VALFEFFYRISVALRAVSAMTPAPAARPKRHEEDVAYYTFARIALDALFWRAFRSGLCRNDRDNFCAS
jgi:hypothetical protein